LAEKEADIRKRRSSLKRGVVEHKEAIASLEQEDAELKNNLLEAMLNDDAVQERNLKQKRKQIAGEIEQHRKDIHGLRDALDSLEDTEQESAAVAAKLDMLDFGYAFGFGSQLRNVLVQNELNLKARQNEAKRNLPTYSQEVYSEVRSYIDEEYAAKQERDGMSEVEHMNYQKRKAEQESKVEAVNTPFVGVGAHGGPRRSEPSEQDFSS
jgi:hypothetical protein